LTKLDLGYILYKR